MPTLLGILVLVAIGGAFALNVFWQSKRCRQRREAWVRNRLPLPDDDFTNALGLTSERERRVACAIRRAVAAHLNLSPELLYLTDSMYTLSFELYYQVKVPEQAARDAIEQELGAYDWWYEQEENQESRGPFDAKTFEEFLRFYLNHLDRLIQPDQQR